MRARQAGFDAKAPEKACTDKNCPFHGELKVRGKVFSGRIVSDKMQKSVIVEWVNWKYIPKFERYRKVRTKIMAHNPSCINAAEGDLVQIGECRPLSKTKNFVIMKVLGKLEKYELEKEAREEGKHKVGEAAEKKPVEKPAAKQEE